jgi:hypothetical protein
MRKTRDPFLFIPIEDLEEDADLDTHLSECTYLDCRVDEGGKQLTLRWVSPSWSCCLSVGECNGRDLATITEDKGDCMMVVFRQSSQQSTQMRRLSRALDEESLIFTNKVDNAVLYNIER